MRSGEIWLVALAQSQSLIGEVGAVEIVLLVAGFILTLIAAGVFLMIFLKRNEES